MKTTTTEDAIAKAAAIVAQDMKDKKLGDNPKNPTEPVPGPILQILNDSSLKLDPKTGAISEG